MVTRRVLLDAAAFADSTHRRSLEGVDDDQVRGIVQRYLEACYDDLGKAPRLLHGDEVATVLDSLLPRHFGVRDPLAKHVESVLGAYLSHLAETEVVSAAFEQKQALTTHASTFADIVASGAAHGDGIALTSKPDTVVHHVEKTGRNDPCPCGSGKKFKKCCMRLGGAS